MSDLEQERRLAAGAPKTAAHRTGRPRLGLHASRRALLLLLALANTNQLQQRLTPTASALKATKASDLNLLVRPQAHAYNKTTRDIRWPLRQVNVLVDERSVNESERNTLAGVFQQLERRTCVHVHRLAANKVSPFGSPAGGLNLELNELERNFIYIFKSQLGGGALGRHAPAIGLSSLGCVRQGRQSLVLTDLAFKWPELVLRYHVMRSLGVDRLERPDGLVRRLLNMLPLSQKITSDEFERPAGGAPPSANSMQTTGDQQSFLSRASTNLLDKSPSFEHPTYLAYATANEPAGGARTGSRSLVVQKPPIKADDRPPVRQYLSEDDLDQIKQLYDCADYQNRLSPKPMDEEPHLDARKPDARAHEQQVPRPSPAQENSQTLSEKSLIQSRPSEQPSGQTEPKISERLVGEAAKRIADSLLASDAELQPNPHPNPSSDSTSRSNKATDLLPPADSSAPQSQPQADERRHCKPLESCPLEGLSSSDSPSAPLDANGNSLQERPMLLKLDHFHAQDPQLRQANQMKLSQLSGDVLQTYRLMNNPNNLADFWLPPQQQQQQQQQQQPVIGDQQKPKSEMLISFEQSNSQARDTLTSLATSQVLKLCSCTCQTMTPSGQNQQQPTAAPTLPPALPASEWPPQVTAAPPTPITTTPSPFTFPPLITQAPTGWPTGWPTHPTGYPTGYPTNVYPTFVPASEGNGFTFAHCDDDDDDDECFYKTTPYPLWPPVTLMPWWPATSASPATSARPEPASPTPTTSTASTSTSTSTTATTSTSTSTSTTTSTTTTTPAPTTTTTSSTTTRPPETTTSPRPMPTTQPPASSELPPDTPTTSAQTDAKPSPLLTANACDQVEWVRPNKTVYASARIVWDVDRGNQNYFLCNNQLNGELVPGKTHGFSCKISQEGKAFEAHNFSVLTKPEHVNLAWVQRNSSSFGKTNFPVVGGHSRGRQEPYIVARCLVKDENNDIITLIGYINNQAVGWFPFDDIQIECSQYDVLACVN